MGTKLGEKDAFSVERSWYKSKRMKLILSHAKFKKQQIEFYDLSDPKKRRKILAEATSRYHINRKRIKTIFTMLNIKEGNKILELGCGAGFSSVLLTRKYQVIGLDLSRDLIRIAKERTRKNYALVDYVVGDAESLPFKNGAFDVSMCIALLHHVPDDVEVVNEMKRVLKKRGAVAVSEPNILNPVLLCRGLFHLILKTQEQKVLRSMKWRITKIFKLVGLKSVKCKNIIFTPRGSSQNKFISFLAKIEPMLENLYLFNNLSACLVITGEIIPKV